MFTEEQIKELKNQGATIIIKKKDVEVEISSSIIADKNLDFEFTKMKAIDVALSAVYDFKIVQDGKEISEFSDKVILTFTVDANSVENPEKVKVVYWNLEAKEWELVGGKYEDGTISVEVDHFSTFTVFETSGKDLPETATQYTCNWYVLSLIRVLAVLASF